MEKTFKKYWVPLLVWLLTAPLRAQVLSAKKFDRLLIEGWATLQSESLEKLRQTVEPCANTTNADFQCRYRLARTCYYLSLVYENQKKRDLGEKALEEALKIAFLAVQQNKDSAEIHSLLADIYGLRIRAYGDLFTAIDNGPKLEEQNKLALKLDPKNPRVFGSLGRQYLFTPADFGGDPQKALEAFKKSLELDPNSDETLFWLSRAYRKLGDKENLVKTLKKAHHRNPRNLLIQQELKLPLP